MKKILVCDDEADLRNIIKLGLGNNFQVVEAENGKIGLDMVAKEKPDLILLDIIMPEMDGFSMLKELRSQDETKNLPVIMLTNVKFDDAKLKALIDLHADKYIVKSDMQIENLISKIRETLGIIPS